MKTIFDKVYDGESLCDVERDVSECFNETYNEAVKEIPVDEYGFQTGAFRIQVIWIPPEE